MGRGDAWRARAGSRQPEKARTFYRDAANAPATTYFNVSSMLDQIHLFENLGFRPDAVAAVKKVLEQRRSVLEKKIGGLKKSEPRFAKVVIASGHMIDEPTASERSVSRRARRAVRDRIAMQLEEWKVGAGDLAICGARAAQTSCSASCASSAAPRCGCSCRFQRTSSWRRSVRLPEAMGGTVFRSRAARRREGVLAARSAQSAAEGRVGLRDATTCGWSTPRVSRSTIPKTSTPCWYGTRSRRATGREAQPTVPRASNVSADGSPSSIHYDSNG